MPTSSGKRFVVERPNGNIEITADSAEQDISSTRVTFYTGADADRICVGSFINVQAWYEKPADA